jgi:hypothetical protein
MGGNSSKQTVETTLQTEVLNKTIQNFITTNSQTVTASGSNIQKLDVEIGDVIGCNINFGQKIDSEVTSSGQLKTTELSDLQTKADTHLDNNVDALMEKMSGFASLQVGNNTQQSVKQTITNKLQNITEKTFETNNYNDIVASVVNIQAQKLKIGNFDCTKGGQLDMSQDISSKVIATALTDQLIDRFMKDEQVVDVINQIETEQANRDEGAGEAVAAAAEGVGEGVGNAARGIGEGVGAIFGGGSAGSIITLIVILLIIAALGYYFFMGKKSPASSAMRRPPMAPPPMAPPPMAPPMATPYFQGYTTGR